MKYAPEDTSSNIHMPCQISLCRGVRFCNYSSFSIPTPSVWHLRERPIFFPSFSTLNHHCGYNFRAILAIFCRSILVNIVHQAVVQNWHFKFLSIFGDLFYNLPPYYGHFTATFSSWSVSYSPEMSWGIHVIIYKFSSSIGLYRMIFIFMSTYFVCSTRPIQDINRPQKRTPTSRGTQPTMTPYSENM